MFHCVKRGREGRKGKEIWLIMSSYGLYARGGLFGEERPKGMNSGPPMKGGGLQLYCH